MIPVTGSKNHDVDFPMSVSTEPITLNEDTPNEVQVRVITDVRGNTDLILTSDFKNSTRQNNTFKVKFRRSEAMTFNELKSYSQVTLSPSPPPPVVKCTLIYMHITIRGFHKYTTLAIMTILPLVCSHTIAVSFFIIIVL